MRCRKVLEASASCLSLRPDRADSHGGGSAPDLRLLQDHGTHSLHEARRIHCGPELANWLSTKGVQQRLICTSGPTPLLRLAYFDVVMEKRTELGDKLWHQGFVIHFLGELIFTHGRMTVAIEIAEIALAVVTRHIDLAPVVLAETYRGLDRIVHRCRQFHGYRVLVQIWLVAHLEMDVLSP